MRLVDGVARIDDLDAFLAELDAIGEASGATIQAFDARYVASERHLRRAVELADRAIERGENVARDRSVEILLYAAGRRQIDRALEMGVSEGEPRVVALVDGGDEAAAADALGALLASEARLDRGDESTLRSFFDAGGDELAAVEGDLEAIVLERVALLDVEK